MEMLLGIIAFIYIVDIFILIWLSGRFAGISPLKLSQISFMGIAIIMVSWLIGIALIYVPFEIKPIILAIGMGLVVYFFVLLLDAQIVKSVAAGLFFIFCQLIFIVVLMREMWNRDLFRALRIIFFPDY